MRVHNHSHHHQHHGDHVQAKPAQPVKLDKKQLAEIFTKTCSAVEKGRYKVGSKKEHISKDLIKSMQTNTCVIEKPVDPKKNNRFSTTFSVINGNTLDVTENLKKKGLNPCALSLAHDINAGGKVKRGAPSQEECLFRRTTLFKSLFLEENQALKQKMNNHYHIPEVGAIYTPDVAVIRDGKYNFRSPFTTSIISSAAVNLKHASQPANYDTLMKDKIRAILRVSCEKGHDSVVLSSYGCGPFQNKLENVVRFFKEVFLESEFKGMFKEVVFAIIHGGTSKDTFEKFDAAFKGFSQ